MKDLRVKRFIEVVRTVYCGLVPGILVLTIVGCTPAKPVPQVAQHVQPEVPRPLPVFPPQKVMDCGNYEEFLVENEKVLKTSNEDDACAVALFNLGFIHVYTESPYYDLAKGVRYLQDLVERYPNSPWAYQARAWMALIKRNFTVENRWKDMREEIESMQTLIGKLYDQIERYRQVDVEIEEKERELLY